VVVFGMNVVARRMRGEGPLLGGGRRLGLDY
jgi:hypothetical protein